MENIKCRVCNSESQVRDAVERELISGKQFRVIAKQFQSFFGCNLHLLEQSVAKHFKHHLQNKKVTNLNNEDMDLLRRFKEGKVDYDEASRIIAVKVFEKILTNPGLVQVRDWLQSELLKSKRQELEERNNWAMNLINRMFSGHLPEKNCVKCGHPFDNNFEIENKLYHRVIDTID